MKILALICLISSVLPALSSAAPSPASVAILYNSAQPESKQLAETYAAARNIPSENLIALKLPTTQDISREEYEQQLLKPLRDQFDAKGWWRRGKDANGLLVPNINKIRILVTMRGVPLRIKPTPKPAPPAGSPPPPAPQNPIDGRDDASVDSELAMFGVEKLPIDGVLQNKFYQSERSILDVDMPFLVLTARIDGASLATCERMIRDAVEAEKTGLWGRAYVDIANKYPQGDQWLEEVAKANEAVGIPTVVDRFNDTLPKNYPMTDPAIYYGWYDWSVSGPFLNDKFRFRKGAVAMHLHSFSAEQLTDVTKNWSAGLLEKGAAVTIGNVYEPYLHLTHDFGTLQKRLLAGNTWVESCWMAMPVASWQGVVLGDPLYRPFRHLDGMGDRREEDTAYRALRAAKLQFGGIQAERLKQLDLAADRMRSGVLEEEVGLTYARESKSAEAAMAFRKAKDLYTKSEDKLRQDFHLIAMDRAANRKDLAIRGLRDAQIRYNLIPETEAIRGWLDILDPPPPPPADPNKQPQPKKP